MTRHRVPAESAWAWLPIAGLIFGGVVGLALLGPVIVGFHVTDRILGQIVGPVVVLAPALVAQHCAFILRDHLRDRAVDAEIERETP